MSSSFLGSIVRGEIFAWASAKNLELAMDMENVYWIQNISVITCSD